MKTKKLLTVFLIFALLIISFWFKAVSYEFNVKNQMEQTSASQILTRTVVDMGHNQQIINGKTLEDIPNLVKSIRTFDNIFEFSINLQLDQIDEDIFQNIKEIYGEIDFYGDFKEGKLQSYDYFTEKFKLLVNNDVKFLEKDTGKEYYIKEYKELGVYDLDTFTYLLFDMDGDGEPELCIQDTFTYVFKYLPNDDQFILWYDMGSYHYNLIGSQKISWERWGTITGYLCAFYQLDTYGNEEYSVSFLEKAMDDSAYEGIYVYMITLPQYTKIDMTENMKGQGYYAKEEDRYYFRVTEEQFMELTKDYFKASEYAEENVREESYTFESLFGL